MDTPSLAAASLGVLLANRLEALQKLPDSTAQQSEAALRQYSLELYDYFVNLPRKSTTAQNSEDDTGASAQPASAPDLVAELPIDHASLMDFFVKLQEKVKDKSASQATESILKSVRDESKAALQGIMSFSGKSRSFIDSAYVQKALLNICTHPFQGVAANGISKRGGLIAAPLSTDIPGLHSGYLQGNRWLDRQTETFDLDRDPSDLRDLSYAALDMGGDKNTNGLFGVIQQILSGGGFPCGKEMLATTSPGSQLAKSIKIWQDAISNLKASMAGEPSAITLHPRFKQIFMPWGADHVVVTPMMPPATLVALRQALGANTGWRCKRAPIIKAVKETQDSVKALRDLAPLSAANQKKLTKLEAKLTALLDTKADLDKKIFNPPVATAKRYIGQKLQNMTAQFNRLVGTDVFLAEPPKLNSDISTVAELKFKGFFGTRFARPKRYNRVLADWKPSFESSREMQVRCQLLVNTWLWAARRLQALIATHRDPACDSPYDITLGDLDFGPDTEAQVAARLWLIPELREQGPTFDWIAILVDAALTQVIADLGQMGVNRGRTHADIRLIAELLATKLEDFKK